MIDNKRNILVTGAKGFVGSNTVKYFKALGFETYGIGHGDMSTAELLVFGLDHWKNSDITINSINDYAVRFDLIIHCGGSGSVGFSVEHPYDDFKKTVDGTLEVLEYMRLFSPKSHLIYPSSPAVQGEHQDAPISEGYLGKPCSPYGYHKKIAEELCKSYSEKFNLKVSIVRLFSVYGIGLKKQLLWDSVKKITSSNNQAVFWGTGYETRDFIHIDDVVRIFEALSHQKKSFIIVNGGTGSKITISEVVEKIKVLLHVETKVVFNNELSEGNPIYYCASTFLLKSIYNKDFNEIDQGLIEYVRWAYGQ